MKYAGIAAQAFIPGEGEAAIPAELALKEATKEGQKKLVQKGVSKLYKAFKNGRVANPDKLPDTSAPETNQNQAAEENLSKNAVRLRQLQEENPKLFATRPKNVPDHWVVKAAKNKGEDSGVIWHEPSNTHNHVRVMRGDPKMPETSRQQPYAKRNHNGKWKDVNGKPVESWTPEAHIKHEEFDYDRTTTKN